MSDKIDFMRGLARLCLEQPTNPIKGVVLEDAFIAGLGKEIADQNGKPPVGQLRRWLGIDLIPETEVRAKT